ncbi:response regulator transcription factor [Pseudorhodoferax sp. Leaf274]|uniref:response regulator n=1 Tax=Pseudorhodoferax sp. Leaf274 TaxID=1736318 RepID=UPI000702C23F|nr:response regulator transcription factor [Pseudorhodoferax sp. Leaf274]KQP49350.1 LuxR family transcriptional regulator [Pseudorhodoferax sp. Leaf274]
MTQASATIRVLLVDDHPLLRDGVRMRLHATPHIRVVGEAGSVREAEALAAALQPDLVVTDIRMPDASGIQLATVFRDRFPGLRVLVLSMHQDAEYVRRAVALDVRGYVLKDGPGHQLVEAIDAVHAGERYFSPGLPLPAEPAPPPVTRAWGHLTPKESAVLSLLADGCSNKEIADALGASVRTVETHRLHLRRKLRIEGQAALVKYAVSYADLQVGHA